MNEFKKAHRKLLASLQERAKELKCIYEVETCLKLAGPDQEEALQGVVFAIGPGWQYPNICEAEITIGERTYRSSEFTPTQWVLAADIVAHQEVLGQLRVYYTEERPGEQEGPFLAEEVRLIKSIADRLGNYLLFQRLQEMEESWQFANAKDALPERREWHVAIKLMLGTDRQLYLRISRKMLNHLCSVGIPEAQAMLQQVDQSGFPEENWTAEANIPGQKRKQDIQLLLSEAPFELAAKHLSDQEILMRVQQWIQEDRAGFLIKILSNPRSSLPEIADAIRRSHHVLADGADLPLSTLRSLRVNLCERFLTQQLDFVKIAKDYVRIHDFHDLLDRVVMPADSHGRLGGKGAGLLLSKWILDQAESEPEDFGQIRIPRTWYLISDGILDFISYNDLEDVIQTKFRDIDDIRREYPNIIQLFKNSPFPPEIIRGLSSALDDLGDVPVIIRSSSLLEDRLGTAFSGKYKSLFLANRGNKMERMDALLNAIAEIYASVFGPDPIEYRRERGLLEFHEEMGILIQEVVGSKVGNYYLPAFAGVAFSKNEFRWSPRISRDDGLIRLVPGLGTRAVDRVSDDYPALVVPGKPNLRVNVAIDEVIRYAPKHIDVINLETNTFETIPVEQLLRECGRDYPALENIFSVYADDMLKKPVKLMVDPERDDLVVTFAGLFSDTPFVHQLGSMMKILERHLGTPVDVEFAHDGKTFYLLQCRPQSHSDDAAPAPIPKEVPEQNILFTAHRYVSNGWLPDITHLVYVDPQRYALLESRAELLSVGRVVGRLNKMLPKRQFILMGPGRWGSRGDIKLGVSVTYADISNTAMLVEIARRSGSYVPDLSFGTHFFQDLVESRIRYLPLYPDEQPNVLNERFLLGAPNLLAEMLPEYAHLAETVRVIDVPATAEGRVLRVLMNAELDEALGLLSAPAAPGGRWPEAEPEDRREPLQFWHWRLEMAEHIAARIDPDRFGVAAIYIFGSVKNATAGPASDIDLLVHFQGSDQQKRELLDWLEGWSLCLSEMNYLRTGYRTDNLLDVHLVTDEDIARKTSYAIKIGAVTDAARELPLGLRIVS